MSTALMLLSSWVSLDVALLIAWHAFIQTRTQAG